MADTADFDELPHHNQRRASRFRYIGVIFLSWMEEEGENYVMGRCIDISEGGLGVELAKPIAVDTRVRVRAEWAKLDGSAIVRHVHSGAGVFHIGLQLAKPLRTEVVERLLSPPPK